MGVIFMAGAEKGLAAAVALAGVGDEPASPAIQLPLLPAERLGQLPDGAGDRLAFYRDRRGPGRPPGAKNRSTEEWRRYLLARYTSPLVVLAEIMSRPTHLLAEEIGCTKAEALAIQKSAAVELAPYLHGKMPVEVQVSGELPTLMLVAPEAAVAMFAQAQAGAGPALDLASVEIVENQGLDDEAGPEVGRVELDSAENQEPEQALEDEARLISDQPGSAPDEPAWAAAWPETARPIDEHHAGPAEAGGHPPQSRALDRPPQGKIASGNSQTEGAKKSAAPSTGEGAGAGGEKVKVPSEDGGETP